MPAHFVDDGWHSGANGPRSNLFLDYATVADSIGVYTTNDYADIVDHLVRTGMGGGPPCWDRALVRLLRAVKLREEGTRVLQCMGVG